MRNKKIRVAALTPGLNTPSSRFRVRQYIYGLLRENIFVSEFTGIIEQSTPVPLLCNLMRVRYYFPIYLIWLLIKIVVRFYDVVRANKSNVIWLQRELIAGIISLEPLLKKPLIFDVDDAIWTTKPFGRSSIAKIAKLATTVVVGNEYLAQWFKKYSNDIELIPTAIDTFRFSPNSDAKSYNDSFVIGWTGSGSNLDYLYAIEKPLLMMLNNFPNVKLKIISDQRPVFKVLPLDRVDYIPWAPDNEAAALRDFDVGLMPLPDNEFTRGKCSFKMLQYMAVALPVVVSPIGMNAELLRKGSIGFAANSDEEWYLALEWIYKNEREAKIMGLNGRSIVVNEYSTDVVSKKINSLIFRVAQT